jgi:predicted nuclease with RNAse H fold
MLKLKKKGIIGIDLAGKPRNPTGWALLLNNIVKTGLMRTDGEILESITRNKPLLVAIDAPFSLPKTGLLRKADKDMIKRGYRVFPPNLPSMRTLTLRAMKLNKLIAKRGYKTIEVHPTSTRKALNMPPKDLEAIQETLKSMGLKGDIETRPLTAHEIDAVTAALTGCLYIKNKTESIGDAEEGYITVPKKCDWKALKFEHGGKTSKSCRNNNCRRIPAR